MMLTYIQLVCPEVFIHLSVASTCLENGPFCPDLEKKGSAGLRRFQPICLFMALWNQQDGMRFLNQSILSCTCLVD